MCLPPAAFTLKKVKWDLEFTAECLEGELSGSYSGIPALGSWASHFPVPGLRFSFIK